MFFWKSIASWGATQWCSWLRHCAKAERTRVWFPIGSIGFFTVLIFPAALWPRGRLSLWQKWIPSIFPGKCLGLTTLSHSYARCPKILRGFLGACLDALPYHFLTYRPIWYITNASSPSVVR
jgi:hypothetical protein